MARNDQSRGWAGIAHYHLTVRVESNRIQYDHYLQNCGKYMYRKEELRKRLPMRVHVRKQPSLRMRNYWLRVAEAGD